MPNLSESTFVVDFFVAEDTLLDWQRTSSGKVFIRFGIMSIIFSLLFCGNSTPMLFRRSSSKVALLLLLVLIEEDDASSP